MLIDSHCHIPNKQYELNPDQILLEAKEFGVEKIVTVGTSLKENEKVIDFAKANRNVFCTIGVYPHEDKSKTIEALYDGLTKLYVHGRNQIVGIGECGLDLPSQEFGQDMRSLDAQMEVFKMQVGFAIDHDLPLVIHNRNGDDLILDILKKYGPHKNKLRGVAHCFTQNWALASELLDLGFYISFSGIVTYPSAGEDLLEVVKKVPGDRYLVETDSPYLAPQKHRGKTNYPKYVKIVAEKVADIRNISVEQVEKETYENSCKLFKI